MTIKAIVCDMDGTLLTSDSLIDTQTLNKLKELQAKGVKLILASGRSYIRLLPDALKLDMEKHGGMLIDVNGTSIYDVSTKKRNRLGMLNSFHINKINDFFSSFTVEIQYSQDDTIYTYLPEEIYRIKKNIRGEMKLPHDYPWAGGMYSWLCDTRDGYPNQHMIRSLHNSPEFCNKMSIVQDPPYMSFVKETLTEDPFIKDYEFVFSDERKMEITNKNINKGTALKVLQEELNIQDDELMVFGDSENDVSMFAGRKYSIAMANALPLAKQSANFHTDDHNHRGVYTMLEEFEQKGLF
ncbi:Cof-type HAD-IIB family hydrolase [Lacticigenium naphthae]|uniref:Cof-type HAD-IIB family hydrolase n=1 Tax=Lacticigenium naphthae TaxID=515351 RepID=UPI00041E5002|nr:Cof-type HAD-IIB family hydrolase [Lacticigenium naphthae]